MSLLKKGLHVLGQPPLSGWVGNLTYKIAGLQLPRSLKINTVILKAVSKALKLNLTEMELPIEKYPNVQALFTRGLKKDLRPISNKPLTSPCDGTIFSFTESSKAPQSIIKNKEVSLTYLLKDPLLSKFSKGSMAVIYLSPQDCHRIFSPCDSHLTWIKHVPGTLFSVNQNLNPSILEAFIKNEKLLFNFSTDHGDICMMMVGAINVGKMSIRDNDQDIFLTPNETLTFPQPINKKKGEWLATFFLGSTIILFTEKKVRQTWSPHDKIKYGESLATFQ